MNLTNVQRTAAHYPGHLALTSCPGSGKTRTLVAKLLRTLDDVVDTTRLVACVTYTNAAVYEIETRLSRLNRDATSLCEVETLHSFCLKHIVAPHSWRLPAFEQGFDVIAPEDPAFIETVASVVVDFGLSGRAAAEFEQLARGTGVFPDSIPPEAANAFWEALDVRGLMDFSSIIYWARALILSVPYVARGLASRYEWILVDEFQDTSALQVDILRAIHHYGRTRFFIVGDPYQSIMSFAGARPEFLETFGTELGARSDLQLLGNYRSSHNILALADRLCPRGAPMSADGVNRAYPYEPVWHTVRTMVDGLASQFIPELSRHGIALADAAVLANRWTSLLPVSRGLRDQHVPVIGPGARPYKRSNHIVAPLIEEIAAQVAEPTMRSITLVRRELRRLVGGLSMASHRDLGFSGDVLATRLIRQAQILEASEGLATEFLRSFSSFICAESLAAGFLSDASAASVQASVEALIEDIRKHESQGVRTTTVRDLGLFARGSNSLRLLTMHGSKGREFEAVALIDVFDGHVPFFKARPGDEIEAEGRRLLYVALTRAKKLLMIFTLDEPTDKTRPSRFLAELFPTT